MDFFKRDELEFFESIAGTPYQADHDESERKSERLKPIVEKSNYWADQLRERLPGFVVENNRHWQTGKSFRRYTWHKVYKEGHLDKLIFFTIGIEALHASLLIKLDCMRDVHGNSSEVLPEEKIERFNNFTSGQYDRIEIFADELNHWGWNRLVSCSADFVRDNVDLYRDAIQFVHNGKEPINDDGINSLITPSQPPNKVPSNVIGKSRTFSGITTDWDEEYKRAQRIGIAGEQFIIEQEELKLGDSDHSSKVRKVKDGKGYDILSYDEKGNEIYIEVKTTTGDKKTPFYMSENERAFMESNSDNYFLYRVYGFNRNTQTGKFYVKSGEELSMEGKFTPLNYEVSY